MLASSVSYRLDKISDVCININDFPYVMCEVMLPRDIAVIIYVGAKITENCTVGSYYKSNKAYLTSKHSPDDGPGKIRFRVDSATEMLKEDFEVLKDTTVQVNVCLEKSKSDVLKFGGPMKVPTLRITARAKNEYGKRFDILMIGFHNMATKLDELGSVCYVDITGLISSSKNPWPTTSIIVKDINLRKEVKKHA